ncbi:hypothetical protein POVCU2_0084950 [Plasmodium ovale curtisi]|uniref:Uncharacterized protein n=1 Tax=Plasmodium ovale curtisi TaxID=864141 RepID=A0A1A8WM21_PLAOA|nr:hypothetical protein POVCU2_0084950 [Plasmodium ovale curtisi]
MQGRLRITFAKITLQPYEKRRRRFYPPPNKKDIREKILGERVGSTPCGNYPCYVVDKVVLNSAGKNTKTV